MGVTKRVADFIVNTGFEDLPPEVVRIVKNAALDTMGVALAGSLEHGAKVITSFLKKLHCPPVAGVIGSKVRTSLLDAALANGWMSHALDYDDVGASTQGHPSSVLVPTVLALGEELHSSGKEIIQAYVLGVEVWARIARSMPRVHLKGWHPTGVLGTLGAAVAAAKLMRLDADQTAMTLGIAASQAAGLGQNDGTMTKPFHAGNAARSGILAAMLAKEGFTANQDILQGDWGFPSVFCAGTATNAAKIAEDLGNPFILASRGITVKKFPTGAATHRPLDGILYLVDKYDIKPDEVEKIDCQVPPRSIKVCSYTEPKTALEGKFSLQFPMAVAVTDRKVGLEQVTNEKVNDPVIKDLMKKVTARVHPDWVEGKSSEARPDKVMIRLKNGREYSHEVALAKGDGRFPLAREELLDKYRGCAKLVLGDKEAERCIELIDDLENVKDLRELMQIVVT